MPDRRPSAPSTGREIAGAWLLCALLAVLAFGLVLTSSIHTGVPPAAEVTGLSPCLPLAGADCATAADNTQGRLNAIVGLHLLTPAM
jgi:hypothetical protein